MTMNATLPTGPVQADARRYGCFPAVIGATFEHRLTQRLPLPSGRILEIGQKIHLDVQDLSRHPDAEAHIKWMCRHPGCAGRHWATKRELVASHPDNRELKRLEEVHCFYGVAHMPAVEGRPAKIDKNGVPIEEAVPAKFPTLLLLSDEE